MSDKSYIDDNVRQYYEVRRKIGTGAYGYVWECVERKSGRKVAVKKIQEAFRNPTDAQRTYREVALLRELKRHPNIVTLLEMRSASNNMDVYLVFEHMEIDLHNLINKKDKILCDHHYQRIIYQILKAIKYIHSGGVVHRDLKPSNILLNSRCVVKVGDLGLARTMRSSSQSLSSSEQIMTGYVATRWYRAPEILLSSKRYTKGVDMWSIGCILGEMILQRPLFQGEDTSKQLHLIMAAIPKPSTRDLEMVKELGGCTLTLKNKVNGHGYIVEMLENGGGSKLAADLAQSLLVYNPDKRLTASQALQHPYLSRLSKGGVTNSLRHLITLSLRDDIQLSVDDYRNFIYKEIETKTSPRFSLTPRHSDVCENSRRVKSSISHYQGGQLPLIRPQRQQVRSKIPLRLNSNMYREAIKPDHTAKLKLLSRSESQGRLEHSKMYTIVDKDKQKREIRDTVKRTGLSVRGSWSSVPSGMDPFVRRGQNKLVTRQQSDPVNSQGGLFSRAYVRAKIDVVRPPAKSVISSRQPKLETDYKNKSPRSIKSKIVIKPNGNTCKVTQYKTTIEQRRIPTTTVYTSIKSNRKEKIKVDKDKVLRASRPNTKYLIKSSQDSGYLTASSIT